MEENMSYLFTQEEYEGKENLGKAFNEITSKQSSFLSSQANLDYRGFLFPANLLSGYKSRDVQVFYDGPEKKQKKSMLGVLIRVSP